MIVCISAKYYIFVTLLMFWHTAGKPNIMRQTLQFCAALLLAVVSMTSLNTLRAQTITTYAGTGSAGFSGDGGAATSAALNLPTGVAVDASGNVYVADANYRIRKITTSGVITTFAGTGTSGYSGDGGAATAARLGAPMNMAFDGSNNMYIADGTNYCVRKISPSGIITTFAGTGGTSGFSGDGGAATAAHMSTVNAVAVDRSGNVLISDQGNSRIRKVSTSGVITTIAGNGTAGYTGDGGAATAAEIRQVNGNLVVDSAGNVYFADEGNAVVRKISTSGIITTFAGNGTAGYSGDSGFATGAELSNPCGVAFDRNGCLYIADGNNQRIRMVIPAGIIYTIAGTGTAGFSGDGGAATAAKINTPFALATNSLGDLFIADYNNNRIREIVPCTGTPSTGNAIASNNSVCSTGMPFTVALQGSSYGMGISFQWQTSTTGTGGWSNISGATNYNYSENESSTTYFQCTVSCSSSGGTSTSNVVEVLHVPTCYCTPGFSSAYLSCTYYGTDISLFKVNGAAGSTLVDSSSCDGSGYKDQTILSVNLMQGTRYLSTMGTDATGGIYVNTEAWIDFNNDGYFDSTEVVGGLNVYSDRDTMTLAIPSGAALGLHRLRLVTVGETTSIVYPTMNPCTPGYNYGEARDYMVNLVSSTCSGTPSAGTATTSLSSVCASLSFALNLSGASSASGLTYQWQSSSDSASWTNITGATSVPFSTTESSAKYYRCVVSCSGTSANSAGVLVRYSSYCYCTPAYTTTNLTTACSGYHMDIAGFHLNGASGSSFYDHAACDGTGYEDRTSLSVYMSPGSTYTPTIFTGTTYEMHVQTWIDFNNDGVFESTESVGGYNNYVDSIAYTLTIPSGAATGTHRMRVVTVYSSPSYPSLDPCASGYGYGEARDYTVNVGSASPTASASPSTITFGTTGVGYCATPITTSLTASYLSPSSGNVTVTAPSGCSVSPDGSTWVSSYTISYTGGTIAATTIYVEFCPTAATTYSGCLNVSGGGLSSSLCVSVSGTGGTPCTGTPSAGTANISPSVGDSTTVFTLSLSGATSGAGITYQWQSAASSGGTYSNIAGATNATYTFTGIRANFCYKCVVSCSYSSSGSTSGYTCVTLSTGSTCSIITTIAGNGTNGDTGDGGAATAATLAGIGSLVTDAAGNVYMADGYNNVIRKISTSGTITRYAGNAAGGYSGDGGPATAAGLYAGGLAMDAAGNLYIADYTNNRVRKVSTSGIISTYAGNGTSGFSGDGGAATAAKLNNPGALAVDASNNLFIADNTNVRIRKVSPSGVITTYCGTGTSGYTGDGGAATAANITASCSMATDASGNLYLLDNTNARVRKVSTSGTITTFAGVGTAGFSGDGGAASSAMLNRPSGITVSVAGDLYISDQYNNRVRKINSSGIISSVAGTGTSGFSGDGGSATAAMLNLPTSIATNAGGDIFIGEYSNYRIRKVTAGTPSLPAITGATSVCLSSTTTLADSISGGTWSSANSSIASVSTGGVVRGNSVGTTTISYTVSNTCGSSTVVKSMSVISTPYAGVLSGPTTVCVGSTITIADSGATGGSWSSSNTTVASVNSSGVVSGITAGTATISYIVSTSCGTASATKTITVSPATRVSAIAGSSSVCVGSSIILNDSVSGGTWTSSSTSLATVTSGGVVWGVSAGAVAITYTLTTSCGTAAAVKTLSVTGAPSVPAITGASSVCVGGTTTLSDASSGGTWVSSNTSVASIGSASGVVTGITAGTATITYTVTNSCGSTSVTMGITVLAAPATPGTISGASSVCTGASTTFTEGSTGGAWTSSSTAVATVNSSGVVTGVTAGTATISYTISNSCGSASATKAITVNAAPSAGTITGTTTVCAGRTTTLTDAASGGTWSSSNTAVATINTAGVVGGVGAGTAIITYTVTNVCGTATSTVTITVNPLPIAGTVSGAAAVCPAGIITLTDAVTGGVWSSSNTAAATVSSSGTVGGVATGSTTISYTVTNSCGTVAATKTVSVGSVASAGTIAGPSSLCVGTAINLTDTTAGGTWSSSNPAVATVNSSGHVTGLSVGTIAISYTIATTCGSASTGRVVSVGSFPTAGSITGPTGVCTGTSITLSDATTGGSWLSSNTAIATVVSSTGVVRGVSAGTVTISYYVSSSCATAIATSTITVSASSSAGAITGLGSVCAGATIALADTSAGGTWSSSNAAKATVSATGVVTGVSAGAVTISYAMTGGCGTALVTKAVTVNPLPAVSTISGSSSVCVGATTTFTDSATGGAWLSSNTAIATVTTTGVVSGVAAGTATITYFITNACGTSRITKTITVQTLTAGLLSGPASVVAGAVITVTSTVAGGTWASANTSIVTVSTTGGMVTGVAAGTDTLLYTISNSCGTATGRKIITVSAHREEPAPGINTTSGETGTVQLYPNPNNGSFTLEIPGNPASIKVIVTDLAGRTMDVKNSTDRTILFDISTYASGTYLLNIFADDKVYSRKVVKD